VEDQHIVARPAVQKIARAGAAAAVKVVVAFLAVQAVGVSSAVQVVVARPAVQIVVA